MLSNYVSALRPADELVVASVVVDVNSFCGCRLAARHVVDAASAESVRLLVNARSGANSFGALADLKLSACASLLMACAMSVRAPASTFATAGVCAPQRQLAGVLYGEKTGHRVERAVSVQWFVSLRALAALQPLAGLKIKPASWRGLLNT